MIDRFVSITTFAILLRIIDFGYNISKVCDISQGWPEGSLFISYCVEL